MKSKNLPVLIALGIFLGFAGIASAAPYNPDAAQMYQRGMDALRNRRLTPAQKQLNELIEKYPDDIFGNMAKLQLAHIYKDLNDHEKAITLLKEIIEKKSNDGNLQNARELLLTILSDLQRFKEAIEILESWKKQNIRVEWVSRKLAAMYLQVGRKDEAWLLLEKLLEQSADRGVFQDFLELAIKTGEVEKLLSTIENRKARYKTYRYLDFVSDCYVAINKKEKAIKLIDESPETPRNTVLLKKLANLQLETQKPEEALITLKKLIKFLPNDWDSIKKAGHCHFLAKRVQEAIATWRSPINNPMMQRREFYQDYTDVLIEHRLYEEALEGFKEARTNLRAPTMFAEEMASVLEALGRKKEALEEYLRVLANGYFKIEVFNKLYESEEKSFSFENRLKELNTQIYSSAIQQALMEIFFRRKGSADVDGLISLLKLTNGTLDDFLFERLRQDAIIYPESFHFKLCDKICDTFSKTTMALRIAILMLDLPDQDHERAKVSFETALKIVESGSVADGELKSKLLVKLAQFAVLQFHDTAKSHELVDMILQTGLINTSMIYAAEAALLKSRLYVYEEDFKKAESILEQYNKLFQESGRDRMFSGDLAAESDMEARLTFEKGVLETHKNNFQEALNLLKEVVEKHPESFWVNDALELALLISRGSTGNFSMLESFLKAKRLNLTGKTKSAIDVLNKEINNQTATSTGILLDMKSMQLSISLDTEKPEELAKKVEDFIEKNPTFHTTADLMCLNMRLKKKLKVSDFKYNAYLQTFVDRFPDDLRSSRFKKRIRSIDAEKQENKK